MQRKLSFHQKSKIIKPILNYPITNSVIVNQNKKIFQNRQSSQGPIVQLKKGLSSTIKNQKGLTQNRCWQNTNSLQSSYSIDEDSTLNQLKKKHSLVKQAKLDQKYFQFNKQTKQNQARLTFSFNPLNYQLQNSLNSKNKPQQLSSHFINLDTLPTSNKSRNKSEIKFHKNKSLLIIQKGVNGKVFNDDQKGKRGQGLQETQLREFKRESVEERQLCNEENIKVSVRFKPCSGIQSQKPLHYYHQPIRLLNHQVALADQKIYAFDHLFSSQNQSQVFQQVAQPIVTKLFQGYNGTIFAYGQTGSGKTHTIFGNIQNNLQCGLIPRSISSIIKLKQNYDLKNSMNLKLACSLVELYKEQLIDMFYFSQLNQTVKKPELKLKQNKEQGVYIQNLTQIQVEDEKQIMRVIEQALKYRRISCTKLNEKSSRSHTILTLSVEFKQFKTKLSLIDLAGSEKVRRSGVTGESLEQTKKINYSLSCLGNVINALTTRSSTDHVPFRDSKLTRILKNSLCGRFLTSIIVTCSLQDQFHNQTVTSLKFAQRAKKVKILPQNQISKLKIKNQSQKSTSRLGDSIQYYQAKIQELSNQLFATKNQLSTYKLKESLKKNSLQRINVTKRELDDKFIQSSNLKKIQQKPNKIVQQGEDLTARLPIPSQRACVAQKITKYKQKSPVSLFSGIKPKTFNFIKKVKQEASYISRENKNQINLRDSSTIENENLYSLNENNIESHLDQNNIIFSENVSGNQSQNSFVSQENQPINHDCDTQLEQQTLQITQSKRYNYKQKQENDKEQQISFSFSVYKQEQDFAQKQKNVYKINRKSVR